MSEPLKLVSEREAYLHEVNADLIEKVEELLRLVREQKITGFAIAFVNADHSITTAYSKTDAYFTLLGAVVDLQGRMVEGAR